MANSFRPSLLAAAVLLSACAAPAPEATAPAGSAAQVFTAAPGDIMVLSDRCANEVCDTAAAATLPGVTELVFLGMRSPTEAVFQRRQVGDFAGPTTPSGVEGVVVPVRDPVGATDGSFIPPRDPATLPALATELVVDPVAGAQFGVEDIAVNVTEISPGRVVYSVEHL
jgi:hypothetical protein